MFENMHARNSSLSSLRPRGLSIPACLISCNCARVVARPARGIVVRMQIEARAPVARVRIGIHSVSGGEAAGAVALAHHWPAAILAERHGSWCWQAHRTGSDSSKLRGPRLRLSCVLDPRTCTVQISRQWLSVPAPSLVPHPQLCGCSCRSSAPGSAVSTA